MSQVHDLISAAKAQGVRLWLDGAVLKFEASSPAPSPLLLERLREQRDRVIEHLRREPPLAPDFRFRADDEPVVIIPEYLRFAWTAMKTGAFGGQYVSGTRVVQAFDKAFDAELFSTALEQLITRHRVLRARAAWVVDQDVLICDRGAVDILQIVQPSPEMADTELGELLGRLSGEPLDDRNGLFRVWLAPSVSGGSALAIVAHHFITDDHGLALAVEDLLQIYEALEAQREILSPRPFQFTDYLASMDRWIRAGGCGRHLEYWSEALAGAPATHLRTGARLEGDALQVLAKSAFHLNNDVLVPLESFCRKNRATLFMGLLAALGLALNRMTGRSDLVLGVLSDGRQASIPWNSFGNFSSVVLIRLASDDPLDLAQALRLVRERCVDSLEHWICPFSLVYPQATTVGEAADAPIVVFRDAREIGERLWGRAAKGQLDELVPQLERKVAVPERVSPNLYPNFVVNMTRLEGGLVGELRYIRATHDPDVMDELSAKFIEACRSAVTLEARR